MNGIPLYLALDLTTREKLTSFNRLKNLNTICCLLYSFLTFIPSSFHITMKDLVTPHYIDRWFYSSSSLSFLIFSPFLLKDDDVYLRGRNSLRLMVIGNAARSSETAF